MAFGFRTRHHGCRREYGNLPLRICLRCVMQPCSHRVPLGHKALNRHGSFTNTQLISLIKGQSAKGRKVESYGNAISLILGRFRHVDDGPLSPREQIESPAALQAAERIAADETPEEIKQAMPPGATEIGAMVSGVRHRKMRATGTTVSMALSVLQGKAVVNGRQSQ